MNLACACVVVVAKVIAKKVVRGSRQRPYDA
jgi:hypothetical protein